VTGTNLVPRVTVVVPARNAVDYVEEALQSVVRQTFADWEVIVVDDDSSDATVAVASGVDPRVTVMKNPVRGGPAAARNLAIAKASGELLALLDADDQWLPSYLEHQVALFDAEQAIDGRVGIVACDALILEDGAFRMEPYSAFAGDAAGATLEMLLRSNPIFISVLAPRAVVLAVGGFEPETFGSADHDLWIRIAERGYRVVATSTPLAIYRKHASNISNDSVAMARTSELAYRRALARGHLNKAQRRIARRSLHRQRSVREIEEFLIYPSWRAVPPLAWARALRGVLGLAGHALLSPGRWRQWAVALLRGRSTLWRAKWDA
jgi:glycosyltransferase involved in cell wall biosynthesis